MKLAGVGPAQARAVSLMSALALVAALAALAARTRGMRAALLCTLLLLFWRNDLPHIGWGVPVQALARSGRYDATVLALLTITLLLTVQWLNAHTRTSALLAGVGAGAAVLTHFLGLIAPAAIGCSWMLCRGRDRPAAVQLGWVLPGFLLLVLPYVAFIIAHWTDAALQFNVVHASRADATFGSVSAVFDNVRLEPRRYAHLLQSRTPGPLLVLAALPAMIFWLVRNWKGEKHVIARAVTGHLIASFVMLALFEPTKSPLYALPLLIPLCLTVAFALVDLWQRSGLLLRIVSALLISVVAAEGVAAAYRDGRAWAERSSYDSVAAQASASLSQAGTVAGATRWWWAFRSRDFTPLITILYRARTAGDLPVFASFQNEWEALRVRYVIRTTEFDSDIARAGVEIESYVNGLVRNCGTEVLRLDDETYGALVVFEMAAPCAAESAR